MKRLLFTGAIALSMAAGSAARADGHISIDINPFGWGAPPPVVYESPRYYAPPPVVYSGHGRWGQDRDRRYRERDHHQEHHDEHHDDRDRR